MKRTEPRFRDDLALYSLSTRSSQERMSLRHKNASKWASQMLKQNPDDETAKFVS